MKAQSNALIVILHIFKCSYNVSITCQVNNHNKAIIHTETMVPKMQNVPDKWNYPKSMFEV